MKPSKSDKTEAIIEVKEPALLMPFLLQNLKNKNRDNIKSLLRNKQVFVNGKNISQFNHQLNPGDKVTIGSDRPVDSGPSRNLNIVYEDDFVINSIESKYKNYNIVYEDDFIIVIDKHSGLLSISTDSENYATAYSILSNHVKRQKATNRIFIIHRLDRDTSGLMMFAKSEKIQTLLQKDWKNNVRERLYSVLVEGKVEEKEGTLKSYIYESKSLIMHSTQNPEKGDLAITHFKTIKTNESYSLLEIKLATGKKNQIRLHMQSMGHSVAGDKKYGAHTNPIGRLGLHASVLEFIHPVSGKVLRFESRIPAKFRRVI